mmetsp:Transcript_16712/g.33784  ORF Transcript_16712/g.33784 Transcript_16712/m.33784 type:complete len:215 (+) Transcript_16712:285-929(+)
MATTCPHMTRSPLATTCPAGLSPRHPRTSRGPQLRYPVAADGSLWARGASRTTATCARASSCGSSPASRGCHTRCSTSSGSARRATPSRWTRMTMTRGSCSSSVLWRAAWRRRAQTASSSLIQRRVARWPSYARGGTTGPTSMLPSLCAAATESLYHWRHRTVSQSSQCRSTSRRGVASSVRTWRARPRGSSVCPSRSCCVARGYKTTRSLSRW